MEPDSSDKMSGSVKVDVRMRTTGGGGTWLQRREFVRRVV